MGRLLRALGVVGALGPVALVGVMVATTPSSAYVVPTLRIAAAGEPVRIEPSQLGAVRTDAGLTFDEARLGVVIDDLARRLDRKANAGGYTMSDTGVTFRGGAPGRQLDRAAARDVLLRALHGEEGLELPVNDVGVAVPRYAIVVRLGDFTLDVYEHDRVLKRYRIGVGRLAYHVHTGEYSVKSKSVNPSWWNPNRSWSRSMPRVIPPGPNNPLGTRALRLDRDLLAIHGTPDPSSIGRRSSRGCMRMLRADVEELFDIVPVDTPVFIYA